MLHRESGVFKTSYAADMALYPLPIARWTVAFIFVLFAVIAPLSLHDYYLSIINLSLIAILGVDLKTQGQLYFFLLFFAVLAIVATMNIVRSRLGRAFIAIRDQDIAAEIIGINIFRYKLMSFAISSFYAGVCGVLYTYYFGIANYEAFQIVVSIDYLAMIIIGGLGSVLGSILGAIFVTMLPIAIRLFVES